VLWKAQADKAAQDELLRTVPKYQTMASTANDPAQTGPAPEGVMAIERAARLASEHANGTWSCSAALPYQRELRPLWTRIQ
jgi:hypothetical protein